MTSSPENDFQFSNAKWLLAIEKYGLSGYVFEELWQLMIEYPAIMMPSLLYVFEDLEVLASLPPRTFVTFTFKQGLLYGSPEVPHVTGVDLTTFNSKIQ
jgi:hypothetical protein